MDGPKSLPTLSNSEGDPLEFISLHFSFSKGTKQAQIAEVLNQYDGFSAASDKVWNWIETKADPAIKPAGGPEEGGVQVKGFLGGSGGVIFGMLELKGRKLVVSVNSERRAGVMQEKLRPMLDDLVKTPLMERQTPEQAMEAHRSNRQPMPEPDIPPEVQAQVIAEVLDRHYRQTLDEAIPALNGKTPRQAVKTAKGMDQIIEWLMHLELNTEQAARVVISQGMILGGSGKNWN